MPTILVPSKSAFPIWHMPTWDFVRYLFSTRKWEESELCFKQTFLISLVLCPHLFHYFYLCISREFSALFFFFCLCSLVNHLSKWELFSVPTTCLIFQEYRLYLFWFLSHSPRGQLQTGDEAFFYLLMWKFVYGARSLIRNV